jgi:hypothetical protein
MNATQTQINALNKICQGWSESPSGKMLVNPNAGGGIIDSAIVSGEWFVIFNDGRKVMDGFDTRDDAIEAFAIASRSNA